MKTYRFLISFVILSTIFSFRSFAGDSPKSIAAEFAKRAEAHDLRGLLALIDGSYKQVQLIGMHKNDTTSFINELFCGNVNDSKEFRCVAFTEIKSCEVEKVGKLHKMEHNHSHK